MDGNKLDVTECGEELIAHRFNNNIEILAFIVIPSHQAINDGERKAEV
jgi:hypothetical protein